MPASRSRFRHAARTFSHRVVPVRDVAIDHPLRARVRACSVRPMEANGVNGQASFDGATLTITRHGLMGRATQGRNTKQIPLHALGAVQYRPPTLTANGVWSVGVVGEVQSSTNARGRAAVSKVARGDENSIIVRPGQGGAFKALGEAINAAKAAPPAPAVVQAPAPLNGPSNDVAAQLRNLGAMHHRGAIDDGTFIQELHVLLPQL